MALRLKPGDRFPEHTLPDETGASVALTRLADGRPLLLAFYRGPW